MNDKKMQGWMKIIKTDSPHSPRRPRHITKPAPKQTHILNTANPTPRRTHPMAVNESVK